MFSQFIRTSVISKIIRGHEVRLSCCFSHTFGSTQLGSSFMDNDHSLIFSAEKNLDPRLFSEGTSGSFSFSGTQDGYCFY